MRKARLAAIEARDNYTRRLAAYLALGATRSEAIELALDEAEPVHDRLVALRARHADKRPRADLDRAGREAYEEEYRRRNEYPG